MKKKVKLVKKVTTLEPWREGENHYLIQVWLGEDGMYYVTSRYGMPFPNGPYPTEEIFWDEIEIIGGPFKSVKEAEEWYFGGEE